MPTFDRYELERLIASGGMAEVHLGLDRTLLRKVALKLPHPHLWQDPRARERFLQEGRIIAALSHENIVHLYDLGEAEGRLYLAMEFVAGESLDSLIRRLGGLPPLTVMALLSQILKGLEAAHAQGVLHRDIKPANLLLTPQGHVKIADFGLSRLLGAQALSLSGQFIGTPRYTAPEVAAGGEHGPQSDIFAAGMVALEMLTGHPVVPLENPQAALLAIREGRFPLVADCVPSLPPRLQQFLQKLLSLDPALRPDAKTALIELETYAWDHRLRLEPSRIEAALGDPLRQSQLEAREVVPLWESEIRLLENQGQVATARKYTLALRRWRMDFEATQAPEINASPPSSLPVNDSNPVPPGESFRIRIVLGVLLLLALILGGVHLLRTDKARTLNRVENPLHPSALSLTASSKSSSSLSPPTDTSRSARASTSSLSPNPQSRSHASSAIPSRPKTGTAVARPPILPGSPPSVPSLLKILTKPGYATVTIDGQDHGNTPTAWLALAPGIHHLRLTRAGCRIDTTSVSLAPAESLEIRRELTRLVE